MCQRVALRCGHTVERFWHDYGFDLLLSTYNNDGEYENGDVRLQVKATDHLKRSARRMTIAWRIELAHLGHWLHEPMPVILIVYDASRDEAYGEYIQRYFEERPRLRIGDDRGTVSVKIPAANLLNQEAVLQFAGFRNKIFVELRGVLHRHD